MTRMPLLAGIVLVMAGCATLRGVRGGPSPESELMRGLSALRAQQFDTARLVLEPVYRMNWQEDVGQQALLALAAAELDPRNPTRRLWAGAELAGRLLSIEQAPAWAAPVAETLYLMAMESGASEAELDKAREARAMAEDEASAARRTALRLTGESFPAQIRKLNDANAALDKKVDQLQRSLAAREKELKDATSELERIKKTLKIK